MPASSLFARATIMLRESDHSVAGKYNYMAPEQIRGEDVSPATDVYALGCLVVECLTGTMCPSGVCTGNACQAPMCNDGVKNGGETGVDCGGGVCPTCPNGMPCTFDADCTSGKCKASSSLRTYGEPDRVWRSCGQ